MSMRRPAAPRSALLLGLAALVSVLAGAPDAAAQQTRDTVIMAGPQYDAGAVRRLLVGDGYRDLWTTPIRVPLLDLRTFAGGLTAERQGGGSQSITLHMRDAGGRRWIFRSVDKLHDGVQWPELRGVPTGRLLRDHVSALHPAGAIMMPPLLEAVGVLHVRATLYVMPDDPQLGEFRATFAGMLGGLELRAEEGPDDSPGFAGSRKVSGINGFLDDLEESAADRLDEHEFLRARLVDFLVGDPDRGTDQWRWIRFDDDRGHIWRPSPIDRDWAFVDADGLLPRLAGGVYPKLIRFGMDYPSVETLTFSSHILDRRLLTRLTRADFAAQAVRVQSAITDDVIDRAVAMMPEEYAAQTAASLVARLRARRDRLPAIADEYYAWLAGEVDVHGTAERDIADIERRADGTVLVRLFTAESVADAAADGGAARPNGQGAAVPYYQRLFLPGETREIRVHLGDGDDLARVRGTIAGPIVVRVIGGAGDDVLEDFAGGARFYDHEGEDRFHRATGTRVSTQQWSPPPAPEGLRAGLDWAPDWGGGRDFGPAVDYEEGAGPVIGAGPSWRRYGFRHLPHQWELDARVLVAPATGRFGATLEYDYRFENSRRAAIVDVRATQFEAFRFYGYGNDSPELNATQSLIRYDRAGIEALMRWHLGRRPGLDDNAADDTVAAASGVTGAFTVGPLLRWTRTRLHADAPQHDAGGLDADVTQLGVRAALDLRSADGRTVPRRGYRVQADARAFPVGRNPHGASAALAAQAAAYVPLPVAGPHLALRLGAERVFGEFPAFDAASIGGRHSLRGFRAGRFTGDAAVHGGAELRVPLDTVTLVVLRGEVGLFGFVDAGRVWHDARSPGPTHVGYGAGLWIAALGRAVSVAVAHGETPRAYAWFGLPY
jgi:hypothetical protein